MAGNIIPAIATTNAMTAGLCVLQAFKVLRDDLQKAKMVFLERSAARVINTDTLKPPNPNCAVCGIAQSRLVVDTSRATLNNLVEDVLRLELGYGDEFSVNNEIGTLYDPELDDNLEKKFADLGIKGDSFLTVIDDDEENPRVNLSFSISEKYSSQRPWVNLEVTDLSQSTASRLQADIDAAETRSRQKSKVYQHAINERAYQSRIASKWHRWEAETRCR